MSSSNDTATRQITQWTTELKSKVKALLEQLHDQTVTVTRATARDRAARLVELADAVRAHRNTVSPMLSRFRGARRNEARRASRQRVDQLKELFARVRDLRRETRDVLKQFEIMIRTLTQDCASVRSDRLDQIISTVQTIRMTSRQFMDDVRAQNDAVAARLRGERRAFVTGLRDGNRERVTRTLRPVKDAARPTINPQSQQRSVKPMTKVDKPRVDPKPAIQPDRATRSAPKPVTPRATVAPTKPLPNKNGLRPTGASKLVRNILTLTRPPQNRKG